MATPLGLVFGLAFVAFGAYFAWVGFRQVRLGVAVYRTPTATVSSLMEGLPEQVSLTGTARPADGTVSGPFSGREAVVSGYEVQELRTSYNASTKSTSHSWHTTDEGWTSVPFLVDDGSVAVRVDPRDATYSVAADESVRVAAGRRPPEYVASFVERTDSSTDGPWSLGPLDLLTERDRKYVERRIEPGDQVTVTGRPTYVEGDVGQVNAVISTGAPFVVSDTTGGRAALRMVAGGLLPGAIGLVFVGVGLFVAVLF
jgi:hypothetical protein